jgi:hypothetical protein
MCSMQAFLKVWSEFFRHPARIFALWVFGPAGCRCKIQSCELECTVPFCVFVRWTPGRHPIFCSRHKSSDYCNYSSFLWWRIRCLAARPAVLLSSWSALDSSPPVRTGFHLGHQFCATQVSDQFSALQANRVSARFLMSRSSLQVVGIALELSDQKVRGFIVPISLKWLFLEYTCKVFDEISVRIWTEFWSDFLSSVSHVSLSVPFCVSAMVPNPVLRADSFAIPLRSWPS